VNIVGIASLKKANNIDVVDISPKETMMSSLDERLRDAFSSTSVSAESEYRQIMEKAKDSDYLSTPGGLFDLQVRLGDYKQQVETISALTRKGVAVVETLLRA
jgi:hypothetical protein